MFEDYYMTADDVAKALKISKSFAYKVIRKMTSNCKNKDFSQWRVKSTNNSF